MPTGQQVFNRAMTSIGMLEQGGTPSPSDSTDGLDELNNAWNAWGVDEGIIYAVETFMGKLVANQGAYNIGSGAQFDAPRPARIYKAAVVRAKSFTAGTITEDSATVLVANTTGLYIGNYVVGSGIPQGAIILSITLNTNIVLTKVATDTGSGVTLFAGGNDRNMLDIVEALKYYNKNDLGATAQTPQELYPDYNPDGDDFARLYLWPIPLCVDPGYLELDQAVNFVDWELAVNYNIPHGLADLLNYALAARLMTRFGASVDQATATKIEQRAEKAEARFREMNRFNRQLSPEQVGLQPIAPEKG